MRGRTESEALFESFCDIHGISWKRVSAGQSRTPDYVVYLSGEPVYVEVKQIDADDSFDAPEGHSSRTVGSHVRHKIAASRKQMQPGANKGVPCVLLVYNNLDPMQAFGSEPHDFVSAMYGEMSVVLKGNEIKDSFHGRNALLREKHNTSFSAVGHLRNSSAGPTVRLYENVFARTRLNFSSVPRCIDLVRIEVVKNAPYRAFERRR